MRPQLVIVAGPNGAGKSSWAPALLRDAARLPTFLNADVIAEGLSGFRPEDAAVAAARVLLHRFDELAAVRASFAVESTVSGRSLARRCATLRSRDYNVHVLYLWLPSADMAVARVARRVQAGGHAVPALDVRRRYARSFPTFYRYYRPVATTWRVYDAGSPDGPVAVAYGRGAERAVVLDAGRWRGMLAVLEQENS